MKLILLMLVVVAHSVSAADYYVAITNHANTNESLPGGSYTITVTGTASGTDTLTVNFTISGTAVPGVHYQAFPQQIKIPVTDGNGSFTFPVIPVQNRIVEDYAEVLLSIQSATATSSASVDVDATPTTLRIYDDDWINTIISFTGSTNGTEGGPNATITASLSSDYIAGQVIWINANFGAGTTAGFTDIDGPTLRIDSGQHNVIADINVLDDKVKEDTELIYFEITNITGGDFELRYDATTYGPIYVFDNNDTIEPVRSANVFINYVGSPREASPQVDGYISLYSIPSGDEFLRQPITVKVRMEGNAIEGVDYLPLDSFVIPVSKYTDGTVTVLIHPIDDNIIEGNEYIHAILVSASTPTGDPITVYNNNPMATVPFYDDDFEKRSVGISAVTNGREGGPGASLTLSYPDSLVSAEDLYVNYHVIPAGTTATVDVDYIMPPLLIPAGLHSATLPINIIDDRKVESTEYLNLQIDGGYGDSTIYPVNSDSVAVITIEDNDSSYTRLCIPNVFTPNGDGRNDLFVIRGLENYPGSRLSVYNLLRGGALVYRSENYDNSWDGRGASPGLYSYILEVNESGRRKIYRGKLVIIK
ncbi:gliding motility-associated C-terminal domain-containing protein [Chitinophaga sp. LS1]|uniref:gliding motility-associated C-terminal domain-containing protein n=1 Tax=Chitinophaga sp. LS1 TaxID=3051176 RepID=UPI002AAA7AF4|nr:gliding motility-associated C-terminal domain-containing protein [Chitinophaga sp. LS1]WPV66370.1 gliding motility-associated C-terminal domain-containing protein [Chitinophaga sp. LS1]